jgi:hypothetical protein
MPGEGIEVDPIRNIAHIPQSIGEYTGQDLLHYLDRLVQEVFRRNGFGDLFSVGRLVL